MQKPSERLIDEGCSSVLTRSLYHLSARTGPSHVQPSISSNRTSAGGGGGLRAETLGLLGGGGAPTAPRTRTSRTRAPQAHANTGSSPASASAFSCLAWPPSFPPSSLFVRRALGHHARTPVTAYPRSTSSFSCPSPCFSSSHSRGNCTRHQVRGAGLRPTMTSFVGVRRATRERVSVEG